VLIFEQLLEILNGALRSLLNRGAEEPAGRPHEEPALFEAETALDRGQGSGVLFEFVEGFEGLRDPFEAEELCRPELGNFEDRLAANAAIKRDLPRGSTGADRSLPKGKPIFAPGRQKGPDGICCEPGRGLIDLLCESGTPDFVHANPENGHEKCQRMPRLRMDLMRLVLQRN
jgi:hypothetical protein